MRFTFFIFLVCVTCSWSQISGCTDPLSKNYNPKATVNDGSCRYKRTKIKPEFSVELSDSLVENSSLLYFDSLFWTINDDADTNIYGMDENGVIKRKIVIDGLKNKEWEEISQDQDYIYLGDFGNNISGNRNDLKILRLSKNEFETGAAKIDTITFNYEDQLLLSPEQPNKTNFDCEAFIVLEDSIYLFTKHYKDLQTTVYTVPKVPGTYIAKAVKTYNIKGLVTGATYNSQTKLIALTAYSKLLQPFVFLLYDYRDVHFFSGNKRKVKLKLPFHQVEGIATPNGFSYYITNEKTVRKPLFNTPQQMHRIDLTQYLAN
ncbi:T9SS C-terminal target domain-containing protein [Flavobacterium algicola]|uniref:T9SS C-terminal target domain-containing protein n=1 Tax=Flavobacterium algicola TaxID=556529 RepID=UPI001EFC452B|nr:T9SS C-terminal target domain-containing protein [Flavobacterium algicola]MCG9793328.1 T9SS C-terminal target domain-containing protein [Flavobacterium algicola]